MVFSADAESALQVLALNAASAAIFTSDIDINTSVSAIRAAKIDGELVLNPSLSELKNSTLDLYLSGTKDDLLMIEMRTFGGENVEVTDMIVDPMLDPTMLGDVEVTHLSNAMGEDEL
jgi:polyribonucleotide nucleotidyltransferase